MGRTPRCWLVLLEQMPALVSMDLRLSFENTANYMRPFLLGTTLHYEFADYNGTVTYFKFQRDSNKSFVTTVFSSQLYTIRSLFPSVRLCMGWSLARVWFGHFNEKFSRRLSEILLHLREPFDQGSAISLIPISTKPT